MEDESLINGPHNLRRRAFVAAGIVILLFSGCTHIRHKPSEGSVPTNESAVSKNGADQSLPVVTEHEPLPSPVMEKAPEETEITAPKEKPVSSGTETQLAKIAPAPAETGELPPATPAPEAGEIPPQPEKAVPPPLDLKLLEKRLKETSAIGIFTKLALKNQVEDLLDKFRDYYQGRSNVTLAQLRQPYEMLIMKVLALLQDDDPGLAQDLLVSREAIWNVLSDPEKFSGL